MQMRSLLPRSNLRVLGILFFALVLSLNSLVAQDQTGDKHHQTTDKHRVDVNSADVKTLETLPGITPTIANRIVEGRPYRNITDLKKINGLTASKLKGITNHITFGSGTTASKTKSSKSDKKSTVSKGEEPQTSTPASEKPSVATQPAAKSSQAKPVSPTGSPTGRLGPGQTVNINTASLEELDALPGIGPTKAQAIIDYRNEHGRFSSIEDIQNVKGIKEGEFSKIKDSIRVR